MALNLYEHNEKGYENLCNVLNNERFATIEHATGTGKSFIALKYIYENKTKKFLYLAPTYEIINQFLNENTKKLGVKKEDIQVDTMIYRTLLSDDIDVKELYEQYDGFILDEYHRAGAPETFKKIKRLNELIKSGIKDKKMIGLSATPIRYLDEHRNMTEELFEGNSASKLTLAEAIAEGILPVPEYINSSKSLFTEYQKVYISVNLLSPCKLKNHLLNKLKMLEPEFTSCNNIKKIINENIKPGSKSIIFCSSIRHLEETINRSKIWFEDFDNVHIYEVHSGFDKKENLKILDDFNKASDETSILFSIEILNEGVHVDDVDTVILNRKTTSPIIYFQQIGRVLSANAKTKTVKVIDLVNNFDSAKEIQNLFDDIEELLNQKKLKDSENKELYNSQLERIRSLHDVRKLFSVIHDIKAEVTRESIVASKIDFAITLLDSYQKKINKLILPYNIEDAKIKWAYNCIYKYEDFITNEQYLKIRQIKMNYPSTVNIIPEERKVLLGEYDSIHFKEKAMREQLLGKLYETVKTNIPDEKNDKEYELYLLYHEILYSGTKREKAKLLSEIEVNLQPKDKILFGFSLDDMQIEGIIKEIYSKYKKNGIIDDENSIILSKILFNSKTNKYDDIIEKLLNIANRVSEQKNEEYSEDFYELSKIIDIDKDDYEEDVYFIEKYSNLSYNERKKIDYQIKVKRHQRYHKIIKGMTQTYDVKTFMSIYKKIDDDNMYLYREKILKELNDNIKLKEYIDYYMKHEVFPTAQSSRELIDYVKNIEYINIDYFSNLVASNPKKVSSEINKNIKILKFKEILCVYTNFVNQNQRKPVSNSTDESEKLLYETFMEELKTFNETFRMQIMDKINTFSILNATLEAEFRNDNLQSQLKVKKL